MTRRNPPAKWVLPNAINPVGRVCMTLEIPDDPYYIAAYRGAILELASAYNWEDDEAHTAKEVAQVMRGCIDAGECNNMNFIQRGCDLFSVVGGVETLIYTAQTCIDNNIADGTLQKANSGYLGNPAVGDCHIYEVHLTPGNTFVLPNVVNTGDTITLSNWQGGATDWGQLSTTWICPSGTAYALGACSNTARANTIYGTDPLQSAPHLAVIAQIGSTYYDVWASASGITPGTFTVPAGIVNQPLRLLMNIGSGVAMVATGEMWGEVTLCNYSHWCYTWDFATGAYAPPWVLLGNGGYYLAGTGYKGDHAHSIGALVYIYVNIPIGAIITEIDATWQMNYQGGNAGSGGTAIIRGFSAADIGGSTLFTVTDDRIGTFSSQWTGSRNDIRSILISRSVQDHPDSFAIIKNVTIKGAGTNNFGASNCV